MRVRRVAPFVAVAAACCAAGVALASHPQVDPATVPVGFLTAHSAINNIPTSVISDALESRKTDVFIEHGRLAPGATTGYQTTPGPAFVIVQKGTLSFQDSAGGRCRTKPLAQNQGITIRTRRVHRLVAGAAGVDYYVVYLLPRRTGPHRNPASAPPGCPS